jgi:hypothetical protein
MNLKKRLRNLFLSAALVGALVGGITHPAFSELSKKDKITLSNLELTNKASYDSLIATNDKLLGDIDKVEVALKKLKGNKLRSVYNVFEGFKGVYKSFMLVYEDIWPGYKFIKEKWGLQLADTSKAMENLTKKHVDTLLDLGKNFKSKFKKIDIDKNTTERVYAKIVIQRLEGVKFAEYKVKEIDKLILELKEDLAEEQSKKFPK